MDRRDARARLRSALSEAYPWLAATDVGPRSVDAGPCDRCERLPRLLPTCGPDAAGALCRPCAQDRGDDAWCDGHLDDGRRTRAWAAQLPEGWADIVILHWISTGEVTLDEAWSGLDPRRTPATLRALARAATTPDAP